MPRMHSHGIKIFAFLRFHHLAGVASSSVAGWLTLLFWVATNDIAIAQSPPSAMPLTARVEYEAVIMAPYSGPEIGRLDDSLKVIRDLRSRYASVGRIDEDLLSEAGLARQVYKEPPGAEYDSPHSPRGPFTWRKSTWEFDGDRQNYVEALQSGPNRILRTADSEINENGEYLRHYASGSSRQLLFTAHDFFSRRSRESSFWKQVEKSQDGVLWSYTGDPVEEFLLAPEHGDAILGRVSMLHERVLAVAVHLGELPSQISGDWWIPEATVLLIRSSQNQWNVSQFKFTNVECDLTLPAETFEAAVDEGQLYIGMESDGTSTAITSPARIVVSDADPGEAIMRLRESYAATHDSGRVPGGTRAILAAIAAALMTFLAGSYFYRRRILQRRLR